MSLFVCDCCWSLCVFVCFQFWVISIALGRAACESIKSCGAWHPLQTFLYPRAIFLQQSRTTGSSALSTFILLLRAVEAELAPNADFSVPQKKGAAENQTGLPNSRWRLLINGKWGDIVKIAVLKLYKVKEFVLGFFYFAFIFDMGWFERVKVA